MISATSDSQDSTDDRFRPEGYDIDTTSHVEKNELGNEIQNDGSQDISEEETSKASSLPGLIM